jgi:hypothetical protein
LIKIPHDSSMLGNGDGLPHFPDGTILVKTFYYYIDTRDTSKGKKITETRLLIKSKSKWSAGTYLWNPAQTDAALVTTGSTESIRRIDDKGNVQMISYHIPGNNECSTCHNSNFSIIPIGPKLRNLNITVTTRRDTMNQLAYFQKLKILKMFNRSFVSILPNSQTVSNSLEERARAYLDVNCAHCHNNNGFAATTGLNLGYEVPLRETSISEKKERIVEWMEKKWMPKLGTTVIHTEGLTLITSYMESLK